MPGEDIAASEPVLLLQEGQRGLDIADGVRVLREAVFLRTGRGGVLRVVWVRAEAVLDGGEAGDVGEGCGCVVRGRSEGCEGGSEIVCRGLGWVAPGAAVNEAGCAVS